MLNFKKSFFVNRIVLSLALLSTFAFSADIINSIGMRLKDIPVGNFIMGTQSQSTEGCPKDNPFTPQNEYKDCIFSRTGSARKEETPAHNVAVKSFYMSETEVTQGQWYEVMESNPSEFKTGDWNMPVEKVSKDDIQEFIKRINKREGTNKYRLPTEAEWEYAARAGTNSKWYCGDNEGCLGSIAVYYASAPKPVKSKQANGFGLYDMSGNVYEWTNSCWRDDYNSGEDCKYYSVRGGSWADVADSTRSAYRNYYTPTSRGYYIGFRLVKSK